MPNFLIKPRFNSITNAVTFETTSLNSLQRSEYNDNFGFYQRTFGVYSYMQMTKDLQFKIHYAKGSPLIWQAHNSCAWTPSNTLSMGENLIQPCKVKVNEQYCYDEVFDSAFKGLLSWGGNPAVEMDAQGALMVDELVRTVVENSTIGARTVMVGGKVHDLATVAYQDGAPTNIRTAFQKSSGSCSGWISMVRAKSTQNAWLETNDIAGGDIAAGGEKYTGDVLALYDTFLSGAPKKLRTAVTRGGVRGFGQPYYPLWLVSPSIYQAVYEAYQTQAVTAATNKPRIERREFQESDGRGGTRPVYVFYIDETVVVPVDEIDNYDEIVTGTSHFAYLTLSGIVQLGASFSNLPSLDGNQVAVMVQMSQNAEDYGTHKFLSHALVGTAINDVDYITGDFVYAT